MKMEKYFKSQYTRQKIPYDPLEHQEGPVFRPGPNALLGGAARALRSRNFILVFLLPQPPLPLSAKTLAIPRHSICHVDWSPIPTWTCSSFQERAEPIVSKHTDIPSGDNSNSTAPRRQSSEP
jgi:hypothetical protein